MDLRLFYFDKAIYRKMENNSANSIKLLENLRCHLFKFSYIIDTIAAVRTQSHILDGVFALIVNNLLRFVCIGLLL